MFYGFLYSSMLKKTSKKQAKVVTFYLKRDIFTQASMTLFSSHELKSSWDEKVPTLSTSKEPFSGIQNSNYPSFIETVVVLIMTIRHTNNTNCIEKSEKSLVHRLGVLAITLWCHFSIEPFHKRLKISIKKLTERSLMVCKL